MSLYVATAHAAHIPRRKRSDAVRLATPLTPNPSRIMTDQPPRSALDVLEFYGFAVFCISLPFVLACAVGLAQSFE